jgi:hypothetical protein
VNDAPRSGVLAADAAATAAVVKYLTLTGERGPHATVEGEVVARFSQLRRESEQRIRVAVETGATRQVDESDPP